MAEVYWDLEWTFQQQGFDYTYDKRLYDRLRGGTPGRCASTFGRAGLPGPDGPLPGEPRRAAAAAAFPAGMHQAAALITFLSPGLRFFHQGQFEGRKKRISPHLVRAPHEPVDEALQAFYKDLVGVLHSPAVADGEWRLLECTAGLGRELDVGLLCCLVLASEQRPGRMLIAVNYAGNQSQCYVRLPLTDLAGRTVHLQDLLSPVNYDRDGSNLISTGLYLDLPAWGRRVFAVSALA